FAVALLFALFGTLVISSSSGEESGVRLSLDFHGVAVALLVFLLGMELVDKLAFRDELSLARDLQSELVLKTPPLVPGLSIGTFNRIANMVGGDLFDLEPLGDGRLVVLFGDASGHGMTAGLVMAVTHAGFRTQIDVDPSPEAVVASLNKILCRSGACRAGGPRQFFAGVALLLEKDGSFRAIVAGHPPVLKVDAGGRIVERIGKGSYPIGIRDGANWKVETGILATGETLLFHSDGLTDVLDSRGSEFGDARVERVIARRAGASGEELVGALSAELADFLGRKPPDDDVSIAAIRRCSGGDDLPPYPSNS
ncbi:MAG TPA: SpoIIE family protein phosphatase, partial [Thermoanaerobaculia bacterium]|nr:SpoIIE family protein phosphatase [Thermoanaerobaculia bacterium]